MMSVTGSYSCFCSRTSSRLKSGARQVCAAEQKVLSIKRGVEFYHCSSKILIIYFIILIVKYSILIINSLKSVVDSVFLGWKLKKTVRASDEQFTFAIPMIFFHSIYFCDVSLKNYLILHVKQNKSIIMSES